MTKTTLPTLPNSNITILDGGMGRELKRVGAPFSQPFWSAQALMEAPDKVAEVHSDFINSGAQIITTNTYAVVPFHIGDLCAEIGADLIKLAAQLANDARNKVKAENPNANIKIAGCIPPVMGSYRADLFDIETAEPLILTQVSNQENYVDFWLAETISNIQEAVLIYNMTRHTQKDLYISFTINDEDEDTVSKLRSGETVECMIRTLHESAHDISGIMFNCSSIEVMEQAIKTAKSTLDHLNWQIPIGAYANSFVPLKTDHLANDSFATTREFSPEEYLDYAQKWVNAGATIIGGCCGISPHHINALHNLKSVA